MNVHALTSPCSNAVRRGRGFTLVELLVVVAIIVIMMNLAIPAFNAIRGGSDFTSELYDISGAVEQARAYAMANNTYVLVGFGEVLATQSTSATAGTGTGRVAVAIIASKDGTRPYQNLINTNTLGNWWSVYGTGGAFVPVTKLLTFQNLHLVDLQSGALTPPASGNMARPAVSPYYDIPNTTSCVSATAFCWPLGTSPSGKPQYTFTQVVEFDPQGAARIILGSPSNNLDAVPYCIEIGLQPAHAAALPPAPSNETTGQIAAIQIDGMSGATRIYRP